MKIDKNYKKLIDEGFRYKIEGNIRTSESLEIDLDMGLYVTGRIEADGSIQAVKSIQAGGSIEAGCWIQADGSIQAGGSIEAGGSIQAVKSIQAGDGVQAGLSITCRDILKCGGKCFAGICTWREIHDSEKTVTCGRFEGGTLEYGILKEIGLSQKVKKETINIGGKEYEITEELKLALNNLKELKNGNE